MGLRRFLLQASLLILPFAIVLGTVRLIDPYSMFGSNAIVPEDLKRKNLDHSGRTMSFSNVMWKMLEFKRDPAPNVIFGDSRLSFFDLDHLEQISGDRYFNFGVPGGNLHTIFDLFEFADSLADLRSVYLQVSFRTMRPDMNWDIVNEPAILADSPMLYLTNRRVIEAAGLNIYSLVKGADMEYDQLPPDQWERVIEMEKVNIDGFRIDENIYDELEKIAKKCRDRNVELIFLEYPMHDDLRAMYQEAGLFEVRDKYVERMRSIAPYIDLDVPGLFPSDRMLWRDPLHLTPELQRVLIEKVWADRTSVELLIGDSTSRNN